MTKLTGPKSFKACIKSRRMPLGRLFQVGGNRLIRLKSREPPDAFCKGLVHSIEPFRSWLTYRSIKGQHKGVVGAGSLLLWGKGEFMLHPVICNTLRRDLSGGKDFAVAGLKGGSERALVRALHVEGSRVLLRTNINAPKASVRDTRGTFTRDSNGSWESRGERVAEVLKRQSRTTNGRPSIQVGWVGGASLEGSIAN